MALQYVIYQDTRKTGGKLFYGRAVHPSTITLDNIADRIQHNCSMTKGDCLAVMNEMITVMKQELQNSNKVCVDGLGTFYIGMRSSGAISEELFDINHNLKGFHVGFLAEGRKQNGVLVRTFIDGLKAKRASGYQK